MEGGRHRPSTNEGTPALFVFRNRKPGCVKTRNKRVLRGTGDRWKNAENSWRLMYSGGEAGIKTTGAGRAAWGKWVYSALSCSGVGTDSGHLGHLSTL